MMSSKANYPPKILPSNTIIEGQHMNLRGVHRCSLHNTVPLWVRHLLSYWDTFFKRYKLRNLRGEVGMGDEKKLTEELMCIYITHGHI